MNKAWVVYSEEGDYSGHTLTMLGVFSTQKEAESVVDILNTKYERMVVDILESQRRCRALLQKETDPETWQKLAKDENTEFGKIVERHGFAGVWELDRKYKVAELDNDSPALTILKGAQ